MRLNEYVFASRQNGGKPITRSMAYRILNGAAKKAGVLEIGTHTLRKTFGYHFYRRTKDVALLQKIFNHSSPSITLRYIGIDQDVIDKAIDGFRL
jgi:integrase